MSINNGIIPITQASFVNGAGNARASAIQQQINMNQKQNELNKVAAGGSRRRRNYRGGTDKITVPQFQMQYKPTGGPGTNPNDQVAKSMTTFTQSNTNSTFDNQAAIMGGHRKYRKGGNPNWLWGCMSGGKSKCRRNSRKSRKHHKKTRRHRHR